MNAVRTLTRPPTADAVPVGRRMLFAERRRATLTILGVACALLLVLVLRGIFAGAIEQVYGSGRYERLSGLMHRDGWVAIWYAFVLLPLVGTSVTLLLPYLFTALKIAATASIVGAIIGEGPGGIPDGLGRAIINFNTQYITGPEKLWAAILVTALLGIIFYALVRLAEQTGLITRLTYWMLEAALRLAPACERAWASPLP